MALGADETLTHGHLHRSASPHEGSAVIRRARLKDLFRESSHKPSSAFLSSRHT